jgi:CheY-like chemotaxis protein
MLGDQQACKEAGMDGYLTKPIDADLLWRTMAAWLRK